MKRPIQILVLLLVALAAHAAGPGGVTKSTPQIRADSDAHWDWRDEKSPNAEQAQLIVKAAGQGDAQAQFRLALMYAAGKGVPADPAKAARWLQRAGEQGVAEAQFNLALAYEEGQGVQQDHAAAIKWYRSAAMQGYVSAQKNLGVKYALGQGVAVDYFESYIWSSIAAQSGDETAVSNAGLAARRLSNTQREAAQQRAALRYAEIIGGSR